MIEERDGADPVVSDFIDEFIEKLIEQLEADHKRWGNTWLKRPKEGQELRTKARFTDYFDMFEEAGTPVPWMKIVGGALICWIRENHLELCPDISIAEECEILVEKHLKESELIGIKVSEKGVEDIRVEKPKTESEVAKAIDNCGPNWGEPDHYHDEAEEPAIETFDCSCSKYVMRKGVHFEGCPNRVQTTESEKPVEDMTTKELVESEPTVQHKSDCAVHNEPAMPAGECDCQDKEKADVQHKPGCAVYNDPPVGFASSVSECDCQDIKDVVDPASPDGKAGKEFGKALQETTDKAIRGAIEGSSRSNPIAHVVGEEIRNWNGILAHSPSNNKDGMVILESIQFTLGSEVLVAWCDRTGAIRVDDMQVMKRLEGCVCAAGVFKITAAIGIDFVVDDLCVSYDYEYILPKD